MNEAEYAELLAIRASVEENAALVRELLFGQTVTALAVEFIDSPAPHPVNPGAANTMAAILAELQAIRLLMERQTSVQAWSKGLQVDPFSPSPADPAQAAEEARSAALAGLLVDPAKPPS